MKYYHEIFKFTDGNGAMHERVHNYNETNRPPLNKPIWGFAYSINDDTKQHKLICKPVLGEIIKEKFIPYKKNSKEFKKSGIVSINSRWYADTKEEAIEMYNELVDLRITKLRVMVYEAEKDKIYDYNKY